MDRWSEISRNNGKEHLFMSYGKKQVLSETYDALVEWWQQFEVVSQCEEFPFLTAVSDEIKKRNQKLIWPNNFIDTCVLDCMVRAINQEILYQTEEMKRSEDVHVDVKNFILTECCKNRQ